MKKHILPSSKSAAPWLWLILHAGAVLAALICMLCGVRYSVSTNLFDILPASHSMHSVSEADRTLGERTGRSVTVLCASSDFSTAQKAATALEQALHGSPAFENISLHFDTDSITELTDFISTYRYQLLDSAAVKKLAAAGGRDSFARNALAEAYGSFTITPLDNLENDPFLLTEHSMKQYLSAAVSSGTALSLKDGVLAGQKDGIWYVLLRAVLSPEGAALSSSHSGVQQIYDACSSIAADGTGIRFIYSGVPFHSYESSSSAQREITLISAVSMVMIVLLLIWIFRTFLPVLLSVCAIGVSAGFALICTLLIFHRIHILTFVFGTTLIGTCLDYSVHFFMNWKMNTALSSGSEIRSHLFRGLTLSLVSTEICYAVLAAAPFSLLRQVGVFSFAGILSTYLTVLCLYPLIPLPAVRTSVESVPAVSSVHMPSFLRTAYSRRIVLAVLALAAAAVLLCFRNRIKIDNNISSLYTMKGTLLENEKTAAQVMNYGSSGWYYIVSGSSPEEVLEHEQKLCAQLDSEISSGALGSYVCSSQFIPTEKEQHQSWAACGALLAAAPEQLQALGFAPEAADRIQTDYAAAQNRILTPQSALPSILQQVTSTLWIGQVDGTWYSAVMPLHAQGESTFRALAAQDPGHLFFVNKVRDISSELDTLTRLMLIMLAVSYAAILVLLKVFYPVKTAAAVAVIPLFILLVTLAVLAACGIPLSFFPVTAVILVFGLGLDYIIYTVENLRSPASRLTTLAIAVSFATTALSFGALALSTFVPVHIFGVTVFAGLAAAYLCALLPVI